MIRQTIKTEEKWVKVESPAWEVKEHGHNYMIEGVIYFDEKYINEEQVEKILKKAEEIYNEKYGKMSWTAEPKVEIYWKELEKTIAFL